MIKRSLKYFVITFLNLLLLTILLFIWTDKLELTFNYLVRPIEFLKIIGFSMLSLVGMRFLIYYFRKRNITSTSSKIRISLLFTLLVSSYLYSSYFYKIITNRIIDGKTRSQIAAKIKPSLGLANGTKADSLTIKEYHELVKFNWLPQIPNESSNISLDYQYDGFLPDYLFSLSYDLPQESKVDTFNYIKGDFSKSQFFTIIGDTKRVVYSEHEQ